MREVSTRILVIAIAAILLLLLSTFVNAAVPPANVVRVMAEDQDNEQSAGTGTLIHPDLIITNYHVVRDCKGKVRVLFPDWSVYEAIIVKTDARWDLAALRIEPAVAERPNPIELGENVAIGDLIVVGGYGSGWYEDDSGKVLGFYKIVKNSSDDVIRVDAEVRNGDSGGPMLKDGKLVGVVFGCSDGTYGININRVCKFLEGVE
ncbi:MAG: S1 family peptidase [Planctomycetota bacterium]|jgi:serine protease DegQ